MAGLVHNLIEVLEKEDEHYLKLLEMAKQKTEVIVNNTVDKLQEITTEEQTVASKLLKLEKQRETILSDICLVLNVEATGFTMSKLIKKMENSEEERERLINLKQKISDKINELKNVNEKNKVIIDQAMDFINFTLNAVRSKREVIGNSYRYGGVIKESDQRRSLFDTKQ